jgi:hypothetical protein
MTPFLELIRAMVIANGRVGLNGKAAATVRVLCFATCLFPFSRHIGRYFTPRSRKLEFLLISQLLILDIAPSSQGASNALTKATSASLLVTASLIPQLTRLDCVSRMPVAPNSTAATHLAC